jgi:hypothetical protein
MQFTLLELETIDKGLDTIANRQLGFVTIEKEFVDVRVDVVDYRIACVDKTVKQLIQIVFEVNTMCSAAFQTNGFCAVKALCERIIHLTVITFVRAQQLRWLQVEQLLQCQVFRKDKHRVDTVTRRRLHWMFDKTLCTPDFGLAVRHALQTNRAIRVTTRQYTRLFELFQAECTFRIAFDALKVNNLLGRWHGDLFRLFDRGHCPNSKINLHTGNLVSK